jgi:hypothetical protein
MSDETMFCEEKHTAHQLKSKEFRCPECKKGPDEDGLVIESSVREGCLLLHEKDFVSCPCGYSATGKKFSAYLMKKKNISVCPSCKGKGVMKSSDLLA